MGSEMCIRDSSRSPRFLPPILNGVRFIDGRKLRAWLASLDVHEVPPEAAKEVIKQLEGFRDAASKART